MKVPNRTVSQGQLIALTAVGICMLFVLVVLISNIVNSDGFFEVLLALVVCGIAIGLQIWFAFHIYSRWDSMSVGDRWKYGVGGAVVPLLAAVAGFFLIAIALAVAIIALIASVLNGSAAAGVGSAVGRGATGLLQFAAGGVGIVRGRLGERLGSVDKFGNIRDNSGNLAGTIDHETGIIRNELGEREGSVSSDGLIRDGSGRTFGVADFETGEVKGPIDNPRGSVGA